MPERPYFSFLSRKELYFCLSHLTTGNDLPRKFYYRSGKIENMIIAKKLKDVREDLKLSKLKLAKLAQVSYKTISNLEKEKGQPLKRTLVKIRKSIKNGFGVDLFDVIGKIVWEIEDLDKGALDLIEGSLLGDGCLDKKGVFSQAAIDEGYLKWLSKNFLNYGIYCTVNPVKSSKPELRKYWTLRSHSCPGFLVLRKKWYKRVDDNKFIKRVPSNIRINPIALLHWYLGDGSLIRDKRTPDSRPCVRLSTEGFVKEDIELLIKKLDSIGLKFYPTPRLRNDKETGYILCSKASSLFEFFKVVGIEPIKEIRNCICRNILGRNKRFGDKWPTRQDWIKILSKSKGIKLFLKEIRYLLGLNQTELAKFSKIDSNQISKIERGKRYPRVKVFKSLLKALQSNTREVLDSLAPLR